jgi:histidinol dehydrogenase
MIRILDVNDPVARKLRPAATVSAAVAETVRGIIADVRERGDDAVRELTARLDGPHLDSLFLEDKKWDALAAQCPPNVRAALQLADKRVRAFHALQLPNKVFYPLELDGGAVVACINVRLARVACYVPGGRASYPSSVIMTASIAAVCEVPEVIIATPPRKDGTIPPEVAAAARIAGVHKILLVGGAQAVATLALGTSSVAKVDTVVGPGNAYVTEAKRQLAGEVRIDSLAGPTEVVIVADSSADPLHVAADLIAQAEHDPLALSLLVTPDARLARATAEMLQRELTERPNPVATESLKAFGAAVVTRDLDEALAFADELAPEHVELLVGDPGAAHQKILRAATVFLGHRSPVPVGDYLAGPSHVLPTGGTARFASPLSVQDFLRRQNVIEYKQTQLAMDGDAIQALAHAEGLHGHARAIEVRRK